MLPEADRKWIKIDQPHVNTFYNVLRQILEYVEKESSLKLSIEAIQKESSTKPGTVEVNQVADSSGGKPSDGSSGGGKGQSQKSSGNQGGKQGGKSGGKTCFYCNKFGHIKSDCRKKKYDDFNKSKSKGSSDSSQGSYSNNSNFKYNPSYNPSVQSNQSFQQSKSHLKCSFCGMTGHTYDECRYRLNAAMAANNNMLVFDRNASSGSGAGHSPWCKYCRAAGHLIQDCRRRMYNEQKFQTNANIVATDQQGSSNDQQGSSN